MKRSFILMPLIIATFAACNTRSGDLVTGIFVHQGQSEYSIAYDTLNIRTIVQNQTYQVSLKTGFHRIRGKKLLPKEFKTRTWQATWDAKRRVLSESVYGRQLILLQDDRTIQFKSSKFTRL